MALFKSVRLRSLKDSPDAFGSTYEANLSRDEASWATQLSSTTSGPLRNTQFAFDQETCAGIAALYREENASSGGIIMMWVAPEYRGSGAARMLVDALLVWAKNVGFTSVELSVTETNSRAIKFYRSCGFQPTGETVDVDAERELFGIKMRIAV